jgi:putative IMPACT (imprinted ancient) family translation regulator
VSSLDGFRVAAGSSEEEFRVKGSRFIAVVGPISDFAGGVGARDAERRRFHGAAHHVYAALLHNGEQRYDDDGEPAGTGGRPTLAAIQRAGIMDVVVIVTRYFGGTKLGTGGLGRAYGAAADLALDRVPHRTVVPGRRCVLTYPYGDTGVVTRMTEAIGAVRLCERYGDQAEIEVAVPESGAARLRVEVAEATAGRAVLVELPGEMLLPFNT